MSMASLAQLAEHALHKRMVMGSIPIGGLMLLPKDRAVGQANNSGARRGGVGGGEGRKAPRPCRCVDQIALSPTGSQDSLAERSKAVAQGAIP